MKKLVLFLSLFTAVASFAKVGDFNSLIVENSKAQIELHEHLKQDLDTARVAYQKDSQEKFIVDQQSNSINVPTSKSLLTFKKEKTYYRPSESKQQKRLAQELTDAE